jgi:hypothetical protein
MLRKQDIIIHEQSNNIKIQIMIKVYPTASLCEMQHLVIVQLNLRLVY